MSPRSSLLRIHDMLEAIRGIEQAVKGKSYRWMDYETVLKEMTLFWRIFMEEHGPYQDLPTL